MLISSRIHQLMSLIYTTQAAMLLGEVVDVATLTEQLEELSALTKQPKHLMLVV